MSSQSVSLTCEFVEGITRDGKYHMTLGVVVDTEAAEKSLAELVPLVDVGYLLSLVDADDVLKSIGKDAAVKHFDLELAE
jgi:hypothetical protein